MASEMQFLQVTRRAGGEIWLVEIDRPPANTVTSGMLDDLKLFVGQFASDPLGKVLILTGAGTRFFVGGAEVSEIVSIDSPERGYSLAKKGQDACSALEALEKPVIAAINGRCIGGGNELALACHMRIASERAVFQQPEVSLGIMPAFGATQRLPRLVGPGRARRMILSGEQITAQEALAWGLVDELVRAEEVTRRAGRIAETIIGKSQVAVRSAERAIKRAGPWDLREGLEAELECFKEICQQGEMKEALAAFRERRKPAFQR